MTRLQRECLAASLVAHTGLLFLLALSSGFTAPKPVETEVVQLLNFVPDVLVDAPVMGGGTPPISPPPAARQPIVLPPVQPPPKQPEPKRVEEPRRVEKTPEPEPPKTSPTGEKPAPAPKRQIEVNLKPVVRSPDQTRAERDRAEAEARRRAEAEAARLAQVRQSQLASAVGNLGRTLSSSTSVSVPGTGGATYASYTSYVDLIYRQAWAPLKPRETGDRSLSVIARVVIARNGDVLVSEIKRRSGNEALDRSVRAALDRVRTIGRPFPEGATDQQREFLIEFNLESRPGAG
jgi:TonB family protein